MDPLEKLRAERQAAIDEAEGLVALAEKEKRGLTDDEQTKFDGLMKRADEIAKDIARRAALAAAKAISNQPEPRAVVPQQPTTGIEDRSIVRIEEICQRPRHISGERAEERAFRFGTWFKGQVLGNARSIERCKELGIPLESRTMTETVNSAGGFTVPTQFLSTIIDLTEEYGVIRRVANNVTMSSDVVRIPRATSGLIGYFPGEGGTITASDVAFDQVELTARKLATLTYVSSELMEDSAIGVGDLIARKIALVFSTTEDQCGFLGDGTSTYGGINGLATQMVAINGTGEGGGIALGTAGAWASVTLADFNRLMGYAQNIPGARNVWIANQAFFYGVMARLEYAAGGNTTANIAGGVGLQFLGFPVILASALPRVPDGTANEIVCYFGDPSLACSFGDRRAVNIMASEHAAFTQDLIAIRATERFDFNPHDLGTQTQGGPLVAMLVA